MPKEITTAFSECNPPLQCVFPFLFTVREAHGIFIELLLSVSVYGISCQSIKYSDFFFYQPFQESLFSLFEGFTICKICFDLNMIGLCWQSQLLQLNRQGDRKLLNEKILSVQDKTKSARDLFLQFQCIQSQLAI